MTAVMTQEVKDAWAKELRETKLSQFRGGWGNGHTNSCCLNILCKVVTGSFMFDSAAPGAALGRAKMVNQLVRPLRVSFVAMNDDEGKSFADIADAIDAIDLPALSGDGGTQV